MTMAPTEGVTSLNDDVAAEIRAWMGRRRVNQAALGRTLGENEMWVSRRLRGLQPITVADLQRIAQALGVAVADLLPASARITGRSAIAPYVDMPKRGRSGVRRPPDNRPPARTSAATAPRLHRTAIITRTHRGKAA